MVDQQKDYSLSADMNVKLDQTPSSLISEVAVMNHLWNLELHQGTELETGLKLERELVEQRFRSGDCSLIMAWERQTGEAIGYGMVVPSFLHEYIADFEMGFVKQSHRRKGVFSDIVSGARGTASQLGYIRMTCQPLNEEAARIFARKGFTPATPFTEPFSGKTEPRMIARLYPTPYMNLFERIGFNWKNFMLATGSLD